MSDTNFKVRRARAVPSSTDSSHSIQRGLISGTAISIGEASFRILIADEIDVNCDGIASRRCEGEVKGNDQQDNVDYGDNEKVSHC